MMAPSMRRKLVLEARIGAPDGMGGLAESWVAVGTLWAAIAPGGGRQGAIGDVAVGSVPLKITVRGAPVGAGARPAAGQRFREGTRLFAIRAVRDGDPQGRTLICDAVEEVAA